MVCLPLAAAAGVLHEVLPASGPSHGYDATYYSPTVLRKLTEEEASVFPKTSASGCIRDGC